MSLDSAIVRVGDTVILHADPSVFHDDSDWMIHHGWERISPCTYLFKLTPTNEVGHGGYEYEPSVDEITATFTIDLVNDPWEEYREEVVQYDLRSKEYSKLRDQLMGANSGINAAREWCNRIGIELQTLDEGIDCSDTEQALIFLGEATTALEQAMDQLADCAGTIPVGRA